MERKNVITMKGSPLTLLGDEAKPGEKAGDFKALDQELKEVLLDSFRDADFGMKYGVLIKQLRLLARALFIIDKSDMIRYVQLVPELSSPPDYDAALAEFKKITK